MNNVQRKNKPARLHTSFMQRNDCMGIVTIETMLKL